MFPAPAGMSPIRLIPANRSSNVPRTRGDEPNQAYTREQKQ